VGKGKGVDIRKRGRKAQEKNHLQKENSKKGEYAEQRGAGQEKSNDYFKKELVPLDVRKDQRHWGYTRRGTTKVISVGEGGGGGGGWGAQGVGGGGWGRGGGGGGEGFAR